MPAEVIQLLTSGRIAEELRESPRRVAYVLSTRRHICPAARAGNIRLYNIRALAQVRHELTAIDSRRASR